MGSEKIKQRLLPGAQTPSGAFLEYGPRLDVRPETGHPEFNVDKKVDNFKKP
jgi:hypothetical protein